VLEADACHVELVPHRVESVAEAVAQDLEHAFILVCICGLARLGGQAPSGLLRHHVCNSLGPRPSAKTSSIVSPTLGNAVRNLGL
jgi:hypothetical protein